MKKVRCAIYTRKSSEDGLEQEFNSLDAQREACEAYIASQKHEGWELLPDHYDDGGISGGHLDRPALQRLIAGGTQIKQFPDDVWEAFGRASNEVLDQYMDDDLFVESRT